jgi:Flp pilus assembly CpaE family ATPase
VTGQFTGTTDEIIQWAALKWGLPMDLVRAVAVVESHWHQLGRPGDGGLSYGLTQIKRTVSRGTYPLSSESTAFNLDYYGAAVRYYYDGHARWLNQLAGEKRVLLIDGNPSFGDVGVTLNLSSVKTIADLAANSGQLDADFIEEVLADHASGLRVLLPAPSPQDAEGISGEQVRAILGQVLMSFDYIFIDARPSFDEVQLAFLDLSDTVLLTLTMEMTAVKAAKQYLEVSELLGYPPEKTSLVLNRFGTISQITVEDIETHLKGEIKGRIPDESALVLRSINEGVPLAFSDPESRFARAIHNLASTITDGVVVAEEEREQRRGLGRLFRRGGGSTKATLTPAN